MKIPNDDLLDIKELTMKLISYTNEILDNHDPRIQQSVILGSFVSAIFSHSQDADHLSAYCEGFYTLVQKAAKIAHENSIQENNT